MTLSMNPDLTVQRLGALDYANAIISKFGGTPQDDLAPGTVDNPLACSLSNTIRKGIPEAMTVNTLPADRKLVIVTRWSAPIIYPLSRDAYGFAGDFDEGLYPDLRDD